MLRPENPDRADEKLSSDSELTPLSQLRPGQKAIVRQVNAPQPLAHRLFALGIVPGTEVEIVRTAALGDPIELSVRGFRIALRKQDAKFLWVEVQKGELP